MGNYFISLLDMVIVIGAPSPPLTIVIPYGRRIQFVVCARFRKRGSDLGYEDMIKYAIKELKTNHGGIVTASELFQPVCTPRYTLPLSKKNYVTAIDSFCLFQPQKPQKETCACGVCFVDCTFEFVMLTLGNRICLINEIQQFAM